MGISVIGCSAPLGVRGMVCLPEALRIVGLSSSCSGRSFIGMVDALLIRVERCAMWEGTRPHLPQKLAASIMLAPQNSHCFMILNLPGDFPGLARVLVHPEAIHCAD